MRKITTLLLVADSVIKLATLSKNDLILQKAVERLDFALELYDHCLHFTKDGLISVFEVKLVLSF